MEHHVGNALAVDCIVQRLAHAQVAQARIPLQVQDHSEHTCSWGRLQTVPGRGKDGRVLRLH